MFARIAMAALALLATAVIASGDIPKELQPGLERSNRCFAARLEKAASGRAVADCTAVIEQGPFEGSMLIFAYMQRAGAHFAAALKNERGFDLDAAQRDLALADLDAAAQHDPGCALCYTGSAMVRAFPVMSRAEFDGLHPGELTHDQTAMLKRAMQDASTGIAIDPKCASAFGMRAMMRTMLGDKAGAEADDREAKRLDSTDLDRACRLSVGAAQ